MTALGLACALGAACGEPVISLTTAQGRRAILDQVNLAVTAGRCADAVNLIEPLYASAYTDNEVRMARASAHACNVGITFFGVAGDLASADLTAGAFWINMSRIFPSTLADSRYESAIAMSDALSAILKDNVLVGTQHQVNNGSANPGSTSPADREGDANLQMVIASMATIGILQNRYSAPDASFNKTRRLGDALGNNTGWNQATRVNEEGCAYAGAVLNFFASLGGVSSSMGSLGTSLNVAVSTLQTGLDAACDAGCSNAAIAGCSLPAGTCATCPVTLRNRKSCDGTITDIESCAAAGIIRAVDTAPGFGWPTLMP